MAPPRVMKEGDISVEPSSGVGEECSNSNCVSKSMSISIPERKSDDIEVEFSEVEALEARIGLRR